MTFDLTSEFDQLLDRCSAALIDGTPTEMRFEDENLHKFEECNSEALSKAIGTGANVYALWSRASSNESWRLDYLGQRRQQWCRERLRQHLFKKHKDTESKIERVRAAVLEGRQMGVTAILVQPDVLRTAVEQGLISRHKAKEGWLLWNKHGRNK